MNLIKRLIKRIFTEISIYLPINPQKKLDDVIVSLTSFTPRLNKLHIVIKSLLRQTYQPAKIILYLADDVNINSIPKKLLKLTKKNKFEIKSGYENLKPHKKYFYVMQEYSNFIVITVDDDLIYDKNLIKDLYLCHKKNPNSVIARRVNLITKNEQGKLNKYSDWIWEYKEKTSPSFDLLATGCGGVLYPSKIFSNEIFNKELIYKYCLSTDDIWLKFMELKNNIPVTFTNSKVIHPLSIRNSQNNALMNENTTGKNRNDESIENLQKILNVQLVNYI